MGNSSFLKTIQEFNPDVANYIHDQKKGKKIEKLAEIKKKQIQRNKENGILLKKINKSYKLKPTKAKLKTIQSLKNRKFNLKHINNDINAAIGKNHIINVNDRFEKFKVNFSTLATQKNPAEWILKKRLANINKTIKKQSKDKSATINQKVALINLKLATEKAINDVTNKTQYNIGSNEKFYPVKYSLFTTNLIFS